MRTFAILFFFTAFHATSVLEEQAQGQVISSSYVCPDCGQVHGRGFHSQPIQTRVASPAVASQAVGQVSYSQPVSSPVSYTNNPVSYSSNRFPTSYTTVPSSYTPAASPSFSSGGTSNVLAMLNSERARAGVPTLSYDGTLQAVAQRRAQTMASMGIKNHPPGSFAPGRYEGVGWSSSYSPTGVSACYTTDPNMRFAGAAMATGSDGVYFVVVYR